MSAGHSHAVPNSRNEKSLWLALGLTTTFLVIEVIAGLIFNSLALLSDAAHMFTDTAALAIALVAIRFARRPADLKRTYGYHRFEILAATFNASLLFLVAMYILYEAWERYSRPVAVESVGMLVVAIAGLLINVVSMRLLSAGKEESLNVKGAYLEVWSDMLGSAGVIVGAIVIYATDWLWVDSLVAVAIGLWVLPRTYILLKESLNILLEGVPTGVDMVKVRDAIATLPGVTGVHDIHVWALTSGKTSLTAHVVHNTDATELLRKLQTAIAQQFAIFHTTFQLETVACEHTEDGCNYTGHHDEHTHHETGQAH